jgi:hypothetical protein
LPLCRCLDADEDAVLVQPHRCRVGIGDDPRWRVLEEDIGFSVAVEVFEHEALGPALRVRFIREARRGLVAEVSQSVVDQHLHFGADVVGILLRLREQQVDLAVAVNVGRGDRDRERARPV